MLDSDSVAEAHLPHQGKQEEREIAEGEQKTKLDPAQGKAERERDRCHVQQPALGKLPLPVKIVVRVAGQFGCRLPRRCVTLSQNFRILRLFRAAAISVVFAAAAHVRACWTGFGNLKTCSQEPMDIS